MSLYTRIKLIMIQSIDTLIIIQRIHNKNVYTIFDFNINHYHAFKQQLK